MNENKSIEYGSENESEQKFSLYYVLMNGKEMKRK